LLPSRAWELLAGSLTAYAFPIKQETSIFKTPAWLTYTGLALIILPYIFYNNNTIFPGFTAIPTIIGTIIIIISNKSNLIINFISNKIFVLIGEISYALYLFHWPVIIFIGNKHYIYIIVISLLCSYLSVKYYENPIRKISQFANSKIITAYILVTGLLLIYIVSISNGITKNTGLTSFWQNKWKGVVLWPNKNENEEYIKDANKLKILDPNLLIRIGDINKKPEFVLWGDSHALALSYGFDLIAERYGKAGYFLNSKDSFTNISATTIDPSISREPTMTWIEHTEEIKTVFLSNKWTGKLNDENNYIALEKVCLRLKRAKKEIFIFTSAPETTLDNLHKIEKGELNSAAMREELIIYDHFHFKEKEFIERLKLSGLVKILYLNNAFKTSRGYITSININDDTNIISLYKDDNHLNQLGSILAMQYLGEFIWGQSKNDSTSTISNSETIDKFKLLNIASNAGYPDSQFELGRIYYLGLNHSIDYYVAAKLFRKSADQDYGDGQCWLGICYFYGNGVDRDINKAIYYFEKAGEKGFPGIRRLLGIIYSNGELVKKDLAKSNYWFTKLSEYKSYSP
jgi:hypothetical protein